MLDIPSSASTLNMRDDYLQSETKIMAKRAFFLLLPPPSSSGSWLSFASTAAERQEMLFQPDPSYWDVPPSRRTAPGSASWVCLTGSV